jgi:hypothetical protein
MTLVTRIRIEERQSLTPKEPRTPERKGFERLMLIVYDTAFIAKLHERDKNIYDDVFRWYVPAKYHLHFHDAFDDDSIVAQVHASSDKYREMGIWFKRLSDLPVAIKALKEKYPGEPIPDQVDGVVDFSTDGRHTKPDDSIVIPEPQQKQPKVPA